MEKDNNTAYTTSNFSELAYKYDEWGNRRKVTASFSGASGSGTREEWYKYDAGNRVLVEAGSLINGDVLVTAGSKATAYSYDAAGKLRGAESWSSKELCEEYDGNGDTINSYYYEAYKEIHYNYNDLGLVSNQTQTTKNRALGANILGAVTDTYETNLETNTYDNRGFKTRSILHTQNNNVVKTTYDYKGRLIHQATWNAAGTYKKSELTNYNYSNSGEVDSYVYQSYQNNSTNVAFANTYTYTYASTLIGLQVGKIDVVSSQNNTRTGTTYNRYDLRGRMVSSQINESYAGRTGPSYLQFVYNATGQIIVKAENRYDNSPNYKTQNYYYSPTGGELANIGAVHGVNMSPLASVAKGSDTPGTYTINEGDTLMGISQMLFGDSKFWYLIADANGITKGPTDAFSGADIGRNLRIPNSDKNISNTSQNWKPYNPTEIIGDLTPDPQTLPPPKKAGCNIVATIIIVVIAVVATVLTAGAAAVAMGASGGVWAAGTAALSGSLATVGAAAGSLAATATTAVAVGASVVGGFVGSLVSQAAAVGMGVQEKINFRQAAASGLTAGFSAGAGAYLQSAGAASWAVDKAATANSAAQYTMRGYAAMGAANYLGAYASNKIAGVQTHFNWTDMAVATVSSAVSGRTGNSVGNAAGNIGGSFAGNVAGNLWGATVSSSLSRLAGRSGRQDWAQMAADAFGNALASHVVGTMVIDEAADALLKKAGLSTDRGDHRVSSDFARDLMRGGLTQEQALTVLNEKSVRAGLLDLDSAVSGSISDEKAFSRASDYIDGEYKRIAEDQRREKTTPGLQTGSEAEASRELPPVIVTANRDGGLNGQEITRKLFTGSIQLLDGLTSLSEGNAFVATVAFEAGKTILTGGPLKSVIMKIAKTGLDGARDYISGVAQAKTQEFVSGLGFGAELNIAGATLEVDASMFGQAAGELAGAAVDAMFDAGIKQIAGRGTKVRNIVQPGDHGTYGDLAARSKKDGLSVDHVPSHASNVRDAEQKLGRKLTPKEEADLKARGGAVVVSDKQHQQESRTYGGRNNEDLQSHDASNPSTAVNLDIDRHREYLKSTGKTDAQINVIIEDLIKTRSNLIPR